MNGSTSGPSTFLGTTIPATCSHGMAWSLPCASCGRPYSPPATLEVDANSGLREVAAAIRELAAEVREIARLTGRTR